ncbi:biotin--[bacterium]|nr:biotin--[acetyl-CoA-carboxylase] ligase [bacterium]
MDVIKLESVNSTNSYSKLHIDDLVDGSVVYAIEQTSGRGRLNRSWVDLGKGNLFMSIVLKPSDKFDDIYSNLTQYLSVCLCRVLETYNIYPQIKWPNDVLINGKKIAGILSEAVMQGGGKCKGIILGIGVNLNAKQSDLDEIPDKIATSLNIEINQNVGLETFLTKLTDEFFKNYNEFLSEGFNSIKDEYLKRNCFLGRELDIQIFDKIENGLAKSVTDNGELVLLKNDKELVLTIGDIL